jgi:hypothetical protein
MSSYRDDSNSDPAMQRSFSRLAIFAIVIAYMVPLLALWSITDFPDSFGIHIAAHGKAGLLENWYYSYLLIGRHQILDLLTFLWMWMPLAAILILVGQFAPPMLRKLRGTKFSLYSDPLE